MARSASDSVTSGYYSHRLLEKSLLLGWLTSVFALGLNLAFHHMWFDELQAWGLTYSSSSLIELVANLKSEGHPPLWHFVLYPLTRISRDPLWMQGLTFLIGSLGMALLWFRSPFTVLEKSLLCLSFQYGYLTCVFSRCYSLGATLIFLYLALGRSPRVPAIRWLVLGLLANVHFFFFISGYILALAWLLGGQDCRRLLDGSSLYFMGNCFSFYCVARTFLPENALLTGAISLLVPLAMQGALFVAAQWIQIPRKVVFSVSVLMAVAVLLLLLPGVQERHSIPHLDVLFLAEKLKVWGTGFLPFTNPLSGDYWNFHHNLVVGTALTVFTMALVWYSLRGSPYALALIAMQAGAMSVVFVFRHSGELWHVGVAFLTFIGLVWMQRERNNGKPLFTAALLLFLIPQAFAGVTAMALSKRTPVSATRQTGEWLSRNTAPETLIMGLELCPTPVISSYLGRDIYFPAREEFLNYSRWEKWFVSLQPTRIVNLMKTSRRGEAVLVVTDGTLDRTLELFKPLESQVQLEELVRLDHATREHYVVLKLTLQDDSQGR